MDNKLCRTCLVNTGTVSIFIKQDDNVPLCDKIVQYSNISINEGDDFPDHICTTCESELAIAHSYVLKCIASDARLRELASTPASVPGDSTAESEVPIKEEIPSDSFDADHFDNTSLNYEVKVRKVFKKRRTKVKKKPKLKFTCNQCGLKTVSANAMKIHEYIHTGVKPFECPYCEKRFAREENRTRHLLQHTRGRKKYERDIDSDRPPKYQPVQCTLCGLIQKSRSAMVIHMRKHTGEKPFPCDSCPKTFRTKGSLKRHHETNHLDAEQRQRRFVCEACGKGFYRKRDIVIHMGIHTGEKPHVCPFCSRRFLQLSSLIRHKRMHTGDKPFSCKICNRAFADRSTLNAHQSVHSDEKNYECHLCKKTYKTRSSLVSHLQNHDNRKNHICCQCGFAFSTKGNLQLHTSRIHSEKSGDCKVCLKTVSNLEVHMRIHSGEKPEVCEICNRAFSKKVSLRYHINVKHKAGKYKCTMGECEKRFALPSMLEFHLLKHHTNHTPHVCEHCTKGFYRVSDLTKHLRVYHSEVIQTLRIERPTKVKTPIE